MKKIMILGLFVSVLFAVNNRYYETIEPRMTNANDCTRMQNNWNSEATAWCSYNGGVDWKISESKCMVYGNEPSFTKVYGRIYCNH